MTINFQVHNMKSISFKTIHKTRLKIKYLKCNWTNVNENIHRKHPHGHEKIQRILGVVAFRWMLKFFPTVLKFYIKNKNFHKKN